MLVTKAPSRLNTAQGVVLWWLHFFFESSECSCNCFSLSTLLDCSTWDSACTHCQRPLRQLWRKPQTCQLCVVLLAAVPCSFCARSANVPVHFAHSKAPVAPRPAATPFGSARLRVARASAYIRSMPVRRACAQLQRAILGHPSVFGSTLPLMPQHSALRL